MYVTLQFYVFFVLFCLFLAKNKLRNVRAISTVIFILQRHIIDSAYILQKGVFNGTTVKV